MPFINRLYPGELNDVIAHVNQGLKEKHDTIVKAERYLNALNICWNSVDDAEANLSQMSSRDAARLRQLLITSLDRNSQAQLLKLPATRAFAELRPFVMNVGMLPRSYNPAAPNQQDVAIAQQAHRRFSVSYEAWQSNVRNVRGAQQTALACLATALYVIRCNLMHCGKFAAGPDREKVERDRTITGIAHKIYLEILSLLLERPESRLVAYDSLKRGGANNAYVAVCDGHWTTGAIMGCLRAGTEIPLFRWDTSGQPIPVEILNATALPEALDEIAGTLGGQYRKAWVPVLAPDGQWSVSTIITA